MTRLQQAKDVDIVWYLSEHGYEPENKNSRNAYYLSPFRAEGNSSFIVNRVSNRWEDWGETHSSTTPAYGDIIDLVSRLESCTTSEAIDKILNNDQIHKHTYVGVDAIKVPSISILSDEDITHEYLLDYIKLRAISFDLVSQYIRQVRYSFLRNKYVSHLGIGFKNDQGGWEIRSPTWKGGTSPKTIRTIKGTNNLKINLFEGFFDYLSCLTYFNTDHLSGDTIILNSASFIHIVVDYLSGYDEVNYFLDNDATGDDKLEYLQQHADNVVDRRWLYSSFKDFNQFLQNQ